MNKVKLVGDRIVFGGGGFSVTFQRTLRIPDDGKHYPLPPGLGTFPLRRVEDYADRVPAEWLERGGVMLPMYQREAMWILFQGEPWKPRAIKIGIGKVCAITGKRWSPNLHAHPQDYVVSPPQPWLDGIASGKGTIRQFVAMPLGMGYTVEGQITGEEKLGGLQIQVFEPVPGRFPDEPPKSLCLGRSAAVMGAPPACAAPAPAGAMGLGAGGRMKQKIYPDPHGIATWDEHNSNRIFVHLVNSELWREITGEQAPHTPVTAKEYARHGLPWFDLYDEAAATVDPTDALANVKSVKELDADHSKLPLQDDQPVEVGTIKKLWLAVTGQTVRDGDW